MGGPSKRGPRGVCNGVRYNYNTTLIHDTSALVSYPGKARARPPAPLDRGETLYEMQEAAGSPSAPTPSWRTFRVRMTESP